MGSELKMTIVVSPECKLELWDICMYLHSIIKLPSVYLIVHVYYFAWLKCVPLVYLGVNGPTGIPSAPYVLSTQDPYTVGIQLAGQPYSLVVDNQ